MYRRSILFELMITDHDRISSTFPGSRIVTYQSKASKGKREKGKGKREMGNGKWEMGNGKREKGNGK
jgi:hypothetical protein